MALPLLTCSIYPLYYLWMFESHPSIHIFRWIFLCFGCEAVLLKLI